MTEAPLARCGETGEWGGERGGRRREGRDVKGGVPREMEEVVVVAVERWGRKVGIGVD